MDEPKVPALPFELGLEPLDTDRIRLVARINGHDVTREVHRLGSGESRRRIAKRFTKDHRLSGGKALDAAVIERAIETIENERLAADAKAADEETARVRAKWKQARGEALTPDEELLLAVDSAEDEGTQGAEHVEAASFVNDTLIAELAWNETQGGPDFIVYDRHTRQVSRGPYVEADGVRLVVPGIWRGIVTPGGYIDGSVFVPTDADESGLDENRLRDDVRRFITRYVELPSDGIDLVVEYVFLTWVFHDFDELAYMGFRTADAGRGKSRALETVGTLCYRTIIIGGGSSPAAMLRIIDTFGGTLLADEFDATKDSELTSDTAKILNQGFQRNRPLIKCVGDHNEPRPFRCYGPKLFALRKGLGDDATESRTLFVTMRQRTRGDIPINLPRREFDRAACQLRNRLLFWRFANLGRFCVNSSHADPRLEDRANQIGLPLMAVAGTAVGRSRIVAALLQHQQSIATERGESFVGQVALLALQLPEGAPVRPNDIATALNRQRAESLRIPIDKLQKPLTKEAVGNVLRKELELSKAGRDSRGVYYQMTATRRKELSQRFGYVPATPTQPTGLHQSVDSGGKTEGCVGSAGSGEQTPHDAAAQGHLAEIVTREGQRWATEA